MPHSRAFPGRRDPGGRTAPPCGYILFLGPAGAGRFPGPRCRHDPVGGPPAYHLGRGHQRAPAYARDAASRYRRSRFLGHSRGLPPVIRHRPLPLVSSTTQPYLGCATMCTDSFECTPTSGSPCRSVRPSSDCEPSRHQDGFRAPVCRWRGHAWRGRVAQQRKLGVVRCQLADFHALSKGAEVERAPAAREHSGQVAGGLRRARHRAPLRSARPSRSSPRSHPAPGSWQASPP